MTANQVYIFLQHPCSTLVFFFSLLGKKSLVLFFETQKFLSTSLISLSIVTTMVTLQCVNLTMLNYIFQKSLSFMFSVMVSRKRDSYMRFERKNRKVAIL